MNDVTENNNLKIGILQSPFAGSILYFPNDNQSHPGVILLHGSEGGGVANWKISAALLAAQGYAVLAYCYFGATDQLAGKRQTLTDVEIMQLVDAIAWLKNSKYVGGKKVALDGASRGAELALLTASLLGQHQDLTQCDAVALHSVSDKVWGTWNWDWADFRCWIGPAPKKFEEYFEPSEKFQWNSQCGQDPRTLTEDQKHAWRWQGKIIAPGQDIQVESVNAPVFISHGVQDFMWIVDQAYRVEEKLKAAKIYNEAHYYQNDGHGLSLPSSLDRREKLLKFYEKYLRE